jgi:hypothetical protein
MGGWGVTCDLKNELMTDFIYIAVVVVFFLISGLYVRLCEKM